MRLAFVRHGEARSTEADPGLTSWGHRAAGEAGAWLAARGFSPSVIWHTPTARTRETADELAHHLQAPLAAVAALPEDDEGWDALAARLVGLACDATIVGHHPTQNYLAERFGPPPTDLPRTHRACVLVMEDDPWRITAAWPGRPS